MTSSQQNTNTLYDQQLEIEQSSVQLGVKRYQKLLADRGLTEVSAGQQLLRKAVEPTVEALKEYLEAVNTGEARKSAGTVHFLDQFEPEVPAYVTAKLCIDAIAGGTRLQTLAIDIAHLLEEQINVEALRKISDETDVARIAAGEHPIHLYKRFLNKLKTNQSGNFRHVLLKNKQQYIGIKAIRWGIGEKLRVGSLLVELFAQSTGLVELVSDRIGKQSFTVVRAAPTLEHWLKESHARCELLTPVYLPMVVPPKPWSTPRNGGYLTLKQKLVLKKGKNYHAELANREMPMVYATLNALQETAWQINKGIHRIMREVWEAGGGRAGLPESKNRQIPAKVPGMADDKEVLRKWKQSASEAHNFNHKQEGKRFGAAKKLAIAEKFEEFDAIYFPHVVDWRGRIYCLSSYVNPQMDDMGKGLLRLSKGKPLGEEGAFWLAVHGANNYGVDKVSFDDRINWVLDNAEDIIGSALDPHANHFWQDADNPWQFLAFCQEWTGYSMQGDSYISHLPVGLDGSCNGLQNFSAALRDPLGGAATNLVPSDTPTDIYQLVADKTAEVVKADAAAGDAWARLWDGKVARWVAKRPTMTMPYGSERYGYRDQLVEEIKKRESKTGESVLGEGVDKYNACTYLAGVIDSSLRGTVVKAAMAMAWLKEVARVASKNGLPIHWVTPSGFVAMQDYRTIKGKRFDFMVAGRRVQLWMNIETDELNGRKMAQAVAPNVIHSFDAAHLCRTVSYAKEQGIEDFAMVHDSYGTHAADCGKLAVILREAFIDQYSGDVFKDWVEQIKSQLPPELAAQIPPPPPQGDLDLSLIRESEYFFA